MTKQEALYKYINTWFEELLFTRDDPKAKYTSNVRYQNVCEKIELVNEELALHEKTFALDQNAKQICEKNRDRGMLIADIQRILPEIQQR